jgi:hypothetical protein
MNGGVHPDLHRPQPAQVALLDPEHGPQGRGALRPAGLLGAAQLQQNQLAA